MVKAEPKTGRTHQIRVHFAALHHPCAGDLTYGADPVLARRLNAKDTPIPYHPNLWAAHRPTVRSIAAEARKILRH